MSDSEYDKYNAAFDFDNNFNRINPYEVNKTSLGDEINLFEEITKSKRKVKSIKKTSPKKNR